MYVGLKQPRGDGERYVTPARAAAKETSNSETQSHYIHPNIYNCSYYMASSVGGEDEPNRAL